MTRDKICENIYILSVEGKIHAKDEITHAHIS